MMNDDALVPTTHGVSENCPRFRLLVVGASGVGKSSLLNATFGLDLEVHSDRAGICDINKGIESPLNPSFVVHDSQGYAPGETDNYDTVQRFIAKMDAQERIADKLHAIWLCIETPSASTLVLQKGAENMLRSHGNVPLIVVFMQYDVFVASHGMELMNDPSSAGLSDEEFEEKAKQRADSQYEAHCVNCLKEFAARNAIDPPICVRASSFPNFEHTISELIQVTHGRVANDVAAVLAIAQRPDTKTKVKESIGIGRKEYWRGLASVTGSSLKQRLRVIHTDIVKIWFDDNRILQNSGCLVASLVDTPDDMVRKGKQAFLASLGLAGPAAGLTAAISGPSAPIAVPSVFVGVLVISWLHEANANAPVVLRRMMAYIVHLVNIMRGVLREIGQSADRLEITEDVVVRVVENYRNTAVKREIDREVQEFAKDRSLWNVTVGKDAVLEKVTSLIDDVCVFEG